MIITKKKSILIALVPSQNFLFGFFFFGLGLYFIHPTQESFH